MTHDVSHDAQHPLSNGIENKGIGPAVEFTKLVFTEARSQNKWTDRPVSRGTLEQLYGLMRWGPTSANSSPMRILFCESAESRERLSAYVDPPNLPKVRGAPVAAIIGYDTRFWERLDALFPHFPAAADYFKSDPVMAAESAFRNSSMQAGYLIIAARMVGLDCGPMSGFDAAKVDAAFFPDGKIKTNLICCLGYGDREGIFPRLPRLPFTEACSFA